MIYRIYTEQNLADTSRDPDQIITNELGYKYSLEDAKSLANEYIKQNFFNKDTELRNNVKGTYTAHDYCSYGVTITIQPINIT